MDFRKWTKINVQNEKSKIEFFLIFLILQYELKLFNYTKQIKKSIYIIYIMLKWVKELLLSTIVLLILDFIYISFNMRAFEEQIALIQRVVMHVRI